MMLPYEFGSGSVGCTLLLSKRWLWGSQSWLQPPFQAASSESEEAALRVTPGRITLAVAAEPALLAEARATPISELTAS